MNKSFKGLQNSLTQDENDPKITKKKKTLIHGKLIIHIKEAKGKKCIKLEFKKS